VERFLANVRKVERVVIDRDAAPFAFAPLIP
jgi:hypothetical protein